MSKYRLLGGVATAAVVLGGLAAIPASAQAAPTEQTTIVVTPPEGLIDFSQTRSTGHNDFLENGLHVWTEGSGSTDKAAGYINQSQTLDSLASEGEPSLDWTLNDPQLPAIPGKQIVTDFDNDGTPDGILVGEPIYGNEWWLSNDAAQWVKDGAPHQGGGEGSPYYGTLAEWATAFPNAFVDQVGYSVGSGVHGDGVISSMTYGDTTYTFALGIGPCEATVDPDTETYTLTQDCTTYETIDIPDGWTLDGAGYTITAVEDVDHPNFPGPVIQSATGDDNGPATMNVENLSITSSGFGSGNSGGKLAGIRYDRAGGYVENVSVNGISHGNGVQEGIGLYVRNRDASGSYQVPPATISVDNVSITRYQKGGIVFDGNLGFTLTNSTVGTSAAADGTPDTTLAANAVQVSRAAHGTIEGNTIGLNEYNPVPPPGDGSDATSILLYDAKTVTIDDNVISGQDGDVGIDAYNDTQGVLDTNATVSCNLFSRDEQSDDYDPYGVAVNQWDDGSTPVTITLSDSSFSGWNYNTAETQYDGAGNWTFSPGVPNQQLGQCAPSTPGNVTAPGGDQQTDVTWDASTAPVYAPILGYTVTATDPDGDIVATQQVGPAATSAHLDGLTSGEDYTISVVANGSGGDSAAGTAVLHATSVTLQAAAVRVKYGAHTTLSGQLSSTDSDAGLAGRIVEIQSSPAGADTWTPVADVNVDASGSFSQSVTPTVNTDYRAVYSGDPDNSSVSSTATVSVAMKVRVRVSHKKMLAGRRVMFSGAVLPSHVGYPVELQLRQSDGTWLTLQTKTLDDASSYGFRWKSQDPGVYVMRVYADGDATHVDGWSKRITITVNPAG